MAVVDQTTVQISGTVIVYVCDDKRAYIVFTVLAHQHFYATYCVIMNVVQAIRVSLQHIHLHRYRNALALVLAKINLIHRCHRLSNAMEKTGRLRYFSISNYYRHTYFYLVWHWIGGRNSWTGKYKCLGELTLDYLLGYGMFWVIGHLRL